MSYFIRILRIVIIAFNSMKKAVNGKVVYELRERLRDVRKERWWMILV